MLLSDLFPNHKVFACESLALLILPEGKMVYRFIQVIYNNSQAIPLETRLQIKGLF